MLYNIFTNKLEFYKIGGFDMRVFIKSKDKYLIRKIELEISDIAEVFWGESDGGFDAVIIDCDTADEKEIKAPGSRMIKLSRNSDGNGVFSLPSPLGFFKKLLTDNEPKKLLSLSENERCAVLRGEKIKLTAHEYALLGLLLKAGGEYTSRETISCAVWNGANDGLINIYIHYLREKLEKNGEKIIISSRKYGYKINERYVL